MKVGSTIKWTDDSGKEVLGQVVALDSKRVKFKTVKEGVLEVLLSDGIFELSKETLVFTDTPPPEPKKSSRSKKAPTSGSKTEAALKLYSAMPNATRQEVIKAFIEKVGLTPSGAATYYTNCKKRSSK